MSLCLDVTYRLTRGILEVLQKEALKVQKVQVSLELMASDRSADSKTQHFYIETDTVRLTLTFKSSRAQLASHANK